MLHCMISNSSSGVLKVQKQVDCLLRSAMRGDAAHCVGQDAAILQIFAFLL